jgi:phosphoglycolate phosphatase-like HAD superfamily hydrolase
MNKKTIVLLDIDYTIFDTKTLKDSNLTIFALYDEVLQVLKKLNETVELGIFSKGEEAFQKTKLYKTDIKHLFNEENVHIFDDKDINLNTVLNKYKEFKIFLVDDRLDVLSAAKKHNPAVFCIWVKRGPFAENEQNPQNFSPDATIENLSSLDIIISQNS